MKNPKKELRKELKKIRKCYAVIEREMRKLVRLGQDQDSTSETIAAELQRQAGRLDKLADRLGGRA
jgi:hypothetical protein